MGEALLPVRESPFVIEVLGIKLRVSPLSFLQVNDAIRDEIYRSVIQKTASCDIVIDAFSGVGILSAILAKSGVKKIFNIEIVPEAIRDANALAEENGVASKVTNILGDVAEELPTLIERIKKDADSAVPPHVSIILDPPRKGVAQPVIDALTSLDFPVTLIYISCNPATLSRDIALLTKNDNYVINSITPYDMFPNTKHLETLVCLSRKV